MVNMKAEVHRHNGPESKFRLEPQVRKVLESRLKRSPRNQLPFEIAYSQHLVHDASPDPKIRGLGLSEAIEKALGRLDDREAKVILLNYGFYDGYPYNLAEIGLMMKVSGVRVREIRERALSKMRYLDTLAHRYGGRAGVNLRGCLEQLD
jgi:DNA-directed RNA polymerase specialized sigma24 family protein